MTPVEINDGIYEIFLGAGIKVCDHERAKADLVEYLAIFDGDLLCPACRRPDPSFGWGLCRGEGNYTCCGHPVRVYHYPTVAGIKVFLQATLPYRLEAMQ